MRKRWKILVVAACGVVAVVAVCFFCVGEREPSYNGRTLSEWLDYGNAAEIDDAGVHFRNPKAAEAIQKIGTNGLPFLISWWVDGDSMVRRIEPATKNKWIGFIAMPVWENAYVKRGRGFIGLRALGTNAAAAVPSLAQYLEQCPNRSAADGTVMIIEGMGVDGLDFFRKQIEQKGTNWRRMHAFEAVRAMLYLGTNTSVIPTLEKIAKDSSDPASIEAMVTLGVLRWQFSSNNMPVH